MGLAERRATQEFQTNALPGLQKKIDEAAGFELPLEIDWDKLATTGESHIYADSWKAIYFEPLIAALKAVARDEMGKEALKSGLKKVIVGNITGNYYGDKWAKFEGGILTLDHEPTSNAHDVDARIKRVVTVLEDGL